MADVQLLDKVFDHWWPNLELTVGGLIAKVPSTDKAKGRPEDKSEKILEELLDLARNQQRLLANPPALLPAEYLASILEGLEFARDRGRFFHEKTYEHIHLQSQHLEKTLESLSEKYDDLKEPAAMARRIHHMLHDLMPTKLSKAMLEHEKLLSRRRTLAGDIKIEKSSSG